MSELIKHANRISIVTNNANLYQEIKWIRISDNYSENLCKPHTLQEVYVKFSKATIVWLRIIIRRLVKIKLNTLTWKEQLSMVRLLHVIYDDVHIIGIPAQCRYSKTILIYKKGEKKNLANFRPISLLATMYTI